MPLSRGTSTGTYSFTDGTSTQTLALALVNTSTNTVTIAGNPFSNGETVVYTVLSGQNIGALASGSHYTIQTSSANSFQFLDPANGNAVVPLSIVPTGTTLYALAYAAPAGDTLSLTSPDAAVGGLQTNQPKSGSSMIANVGTNVEFCPNDTSKPRCGNSPSG